MKNGLSAMKTLKIALTILLVVNLTACGKKTKTPPPLLSDSGLPTEDISGTTEPGGGAYSSSGGGLDSGAGTGTGSPGARDRWTESTGEQPLTQRPYTGEWTSDPNLSTIYFEYNSFELTSEGKSLLQHNAEYMKQNPNIRALIEGHCDERGTEEYNQALGERRALSAREYLIGLGISSARIDIISYGELRPAVEGSGEAAWSRNRRAEFKIAG
jgi:peptidoglycan-associated lipoprotein